jgi:hypothetical protein
MIVNNILYKKEGRMPIRRNLMQQRKQIAKRNNAMTQKRRSSITSYYRTEQTIHKSEINIQK